MIINRFDSNEINVGHGQLLLDHGNCSTIEASICYSSIQHVNNPVIFDIGANIGTFTTWIAKTFKSGKIYCFEPQRSVFQILCGNAAINNLYNVYAYNIALGNENKRIKITEPNYFHNADFGTFSLVEDVIPEKSSDELTIQVNTLDWFVDYYNVEKVDFLKIDVEGMDLDVLLGALNTIEKFTPVIFIEHNNYRRTVIEEIKELLDKFNYQYETYENNLLCKR
jgi:FkbM family methyltransferase